MKKGASEDSGLQWNFMVPKAELEPAMMEGTTRCGPCARRSIAGAVIIGLIWLSIAALAIHWLVV